PAGRGAGGRRLPGGGRVRADRGRRPPRPGAAAADRPAPVVTPMPEFPFHPSNTRGGGPPEFAGLHAAADLLIGLAFLVIPVALAYFLRRRRDVPFPRMFALFAALILCCGTTFLADA